MQGDACRTAVESGLALGYRHLDTAEMYGNEEADWRRDCSLAMFPAKICMSPQKSGTKIWRRMRSAGRSILP